MTDPKVLLLEDSRSLQVILTKTLSNLTKAVKPLDDPAQVIHNFSIKLDDFDLFIMNLKYQDQIFPKFVVHDRPRMKFPPTLGITKNLSVYDSVDALNKGVDDCITYPFHKENLVARAKALIRRPKEKVTPEYRVGDFRIRRNSMQINYQTNKLNLSKKEFLILSILLENPNRTITKRELLRRVWFVEKAPSANTLDVHISNIRKKVGNSSRTKKIIQTVHGIGYRAKLSSDYLSSVKTKYT